jgi:hypothetical protein
VTNAVRAAAARIEDAEWMKVISDELPTRAQSEKYKHNVFPIAALASLSGVATGWSTIQSRHLFGTSTKV